MGVARWCAVATLVLGLGACAVPVSMVGSDAVVEYAGTQGFRAVEEGDAAGLFVRVSGWPKDSAMVPDRLEVVENFDSVDVLVHLALARPGMRGDFSYRIAVPDSTRVLRFGRHRVIVWRRTGPVQATTVL